MLIEKGKAVIILVRNKNNEINERIGKRSARQIVDKT